ncbi:MAG TPA: DUF1549 domain-containing protein, partial [Gemmataceae bacterium]|nr:DUF1549 domain-containing protein [Gemmataceae bacterium]
MISYSAFAVPFLLLVPAADDGAGAGLFREKVRPVLQRCVNCHSGDEPAGGLNLTTRPLAVKGGESGPALRPGRAAESLLFSKIASKMMPPKKPLSAEEVAVLRRWIDDGAAWEGTVARVRKPVTGGPKRAGPDWWSLQPVRRPPLPAVKRKQWLRTPVDAFVLAALEAKGLTPAPLADRSTLLRRITFDLTGLPPSPAEVAEFLKDESPDAYERMVERLLSSPHYGERWGRYWLDVARFGESQGFERDKLRDHSWRYRDWVIRAFNEDKPYPQFVKEQLAGDVVEPVTADGIIATGFLVAGPWDEVGATQQGALMRMRVREEELEDIVSATAQTFLGMTVNCARCHDHKFDPIAQKDYYRLKAALEGVRPGDRPILTPAQVKAREAALARLRQDVARLERAVADIEAVGREKVRRSGKRTAEKDLPKPVARWSFEADARDSVGGLHGTLESGAVIEGGRLKLNGKGAFVRTELLSRDLREKTLEVWTTLSTLTQRGGGVLSVQTRDGRVFDAIVFGEREPKKWIAGSDFFRRTRDLAGPEETARPSDLVHIAIVYAADNSITVYRNGVPYGASYVPDGGEGRLRTYAARDSHVLFGLRHTGAGNGHFAGEIEEARLYDRALSAREVAVSFRAGVERVSLEQVLAALTPEQRSQREKSLTELEAKRAALREGSSVPMAYAANAVQPGPTHILIRGDVEKQGALVSAGGLSVIRAPSPEWGLAADAPEGQRRLKLAEWIASADNPLTARVMVNRVWQYHFGRGLVEAPSDFGFHGGMPTHPELLDWLASEFTGQASGGRQSPEAWGMKALHRVIVLSNAYRQSSRFDARAAEVDADNRLLWRFAPRRLEGEAVRDAMLSASGELNRTIGGPSFRPFTVTIFNSHFYTLTDPPGTEYNRRTVYRMNVNSAKSPLLDAFDCPDPSVKTPRRSTTTTPLQALALMNNSFVQRQAKHFAARVQREAG